LPNLEERKILALGNSLAITLPKPWTRFWGIKSGDVVQVTTNGVLRVSPQRSSRRNINKIPN
jgi:antitoxin component of MazEF toxin-antitoxin module